MGGEGELWWWGPQVLLESQFFLNQKLYETVTLHKIQEENGEGELWGNKDPTVLLL